MDKYLAVTGRVLMASVFLGLVSLRIVAITSQPNGYEAYQLLLAHFGLPGIAAPLIVLLQIVGGVALLVGFKTRFFACLLAVYSVFLGIVLGSVQLDLLFVYIGIAGGLLSLAAHPNTPYSLDNLRK